MLTRPEIFFVINRFIGVEGGYLGVGENRFSYRSHKEFYPEYCNLDLNPDVYNGTTRDRFFAVLTNSDQLTQAKILKGLLSKFPIESFPATDEEIKAAQITKIENLIFRLQTGQILESDNLEITSEVVERAIQDTKVLLEKSGAISGVDRIHTALHGYLKAVCKHEKINFDESATLTQLFKVLKMNHGAFKTPGSRQDDIDQIINSFSNILDKLNPIRNNASMAHPTDELLHEAEATFVINAARTVMNYLNKKFLR